MKKILCAFTTLFLAIAICIPAFAETDNNNIFDNTDFFRQYENEILEEVNYYFINEFNEEISANDLDYSNILKFYYPFELLQENNLNINTLNNIIEKSDYFYKLFAEKNEHYIEIGYQKYAKVTEELRNTLDDEMLKELEAVTGQWHSSSVSLSEGKSQYLIYKDDILNLMKSNNLKCSKVHFISSLSGNIQIASVLVTEDSEIFFKILKGTVNGETIDHNNPDNKLYTFEEIKEFAAQYVAPEVDNPLSAEVIGMPTSGTNSNNSNTIIIAAASAGAVIVIAAITAAVFIYKKKHKRNETVWKSCVIST